MKKKILSLVLALLLIAISGCKQDDKELGSQTPSPEPMKVTIESLLNEMADLDQLTKKPVEGVTAAQFSSYDRKSKVINGEKRDWFENADSNQFIRTFYNQGRQEMVMVEVDGPGTLTRIWSATPRGTLRIYIDGAKEPTIEQDYYQMAFGYGEYPFTGAFAGRHGSAGNIYFPIPFEKSILVTVENPGWFYYHVNYRLYPEGTEVESFTYDRALKAKETADKVNARLSEPYSSWEMPDNAETKAISETISPGKSFTLQLEGPAEVVKLELKASAYNMEKALRDTLIKITWDDNDSPSVWSPLGDFFGTAPGINPYQGLPSGMLEDGLMYSHWPMPFKKKAVLEILNEGDEDIALEGKAVTRSIKWDGSYLYFHSKWHSEYDMPTRPIKDWTALDTKGPGRFVGLSLNIVNTGIFWWGEGDEKIYVDGEDFPSTFGTGTEDYFGYAWCNPEIFSHAYHNQPRADIPTGHISNNRFQIFDNIPFQKSIRFDLERLSTDEGAKMGYSATSYWYTSAVNEDFFKPIPVVDRYVKEFEPLKRYTVEDVLEGEDLVISRINGGNAGIQGMFIFGDKWSRGKHVIWTPDQIGDSLEFILPAEKSGRYRVSAALTKASDYGQVKIEINGRVMSEMIDLYDTKVTAETYNLGEVDLTEGENRLKVTVTGKNIKSTKILFALDYIRLEDLK